MEDHGRSRAAWRLKMEARRACRPVVADSHPLDEEQDQDPDPDPH